MADAALEGRTGDVVEDGSGFVPDGGDGSPAAESGKPSVADVLRGDDGDADAGGDGDDEEPEGGGRPPNGRAGPDPSGPDPSSGVFAAGSGAEVPPSGSGDAGGGVRPAEEQLVVRNEDIDVVKNAVAGQAEDNRDAASDKTVSDVRKEVRRILGLDKKPDFEAESLQHVMGLTRDGEPVNLELEQELLAEIAAVGLDLEAVKLRYATLVEEDRRRLTTFEVQQAFVSALDRVEDVANKVSERLGLRIQMFEAHAKDQLKLVSALRELVDAEKRKVEEMAAGVRQRVEAEKTDLERLIERVAGEREQLRELLEENPANVAGEARKKLNEQVQALEKAFGDVGGHLKSCETRAHEITDRLSSAGAAATAVEQEAARVMSELQRVASAGFAVRRLALLGGVIGSAVGGFFAFVVLLLLWAVTGGS